MIGKANMSGLLNTIIKNSVSYMEYRIFYPIVSLLPTNFAIKIATAKGVLEGVFCQKTISTCIANLEQCLSLSDEEYRKIAKSQLCMLAREKMDTYCLSKMNERNLENYIKVKGLTHYIEAKETKKPVILYTSHFGRMIMPAIALGLSGYETSSLTAPSEQGCPKHVTEYVQKKIKLMQSIMKGTFVTTDQSMRKLYKILAQGDTLIVAVDVVTQPGQSFYQGEFLNGEVRFPKGIVKLAKKMDAILVPYFALEHDGHLSAEILPAIETEGLDEKTIFHLLLKPIEEKIMKYPEQWWLWPMLNLFWNKEPGNA